MKQLVIIVLLLASMYAKSQHVDVVDFKQLEPHLYTSTDTTYVVNFWATWCKPCVEELPAFLKVEQELKDEKFKLILVTLDFASHLNQRVKPFLTKKNITSQVILLDDPDANTWIPKVNKDWDGSIPVTLIFNKNERIFIDGTMEYNELKEHVNKLLN